MSWIDISILNNKENWTKNFLNVDFEVIDIYYLIIFYNHFMFQIIFNAL